MASDTSSIDAAVIAKLAGDATLMALMPDGVFADVAASGKTTFVLVSQSTHEDDYMLGGRSWEIVTYLIKAVDRNISGTTVKTAAARIDVLLQDVALTITGYDHMSTTRTERVRYTEVDSVDQDIRWQHRGGMYEVMAAPQ